MREREGEKERRYFLSAITGDGCEKASGKMLDAGWARDRCEKDPPR